MFLRMLLVAASIIVFVGCAAVAPQPNLNSNSPASPTAAEVPVPSRSQTLTVDDGSPPHPAINPQTLMPKMGHQMPGMQHDMQGMHDDHGAHVSAATNPGENAAIPAPHWMPTTFPTTGPATAPTVYTCKMHPEVLSNVPGKCPKCGMRLIPKPQDAKQPGHADHGGHQ